MKKILLPFIFLFFVSIIYAETVILNDGTTYVGNIHLQNEQNVYIVCGDDLIKLDTKDIKEIKKEDPKEKNDLQLDNNTLEEPSFNEIILQVGYDFYGKYSSNKIETSNPKGATFSAQYYRYINSVFAIGCGANIQTSREVDNLSGKFYFLPMYVSLKLRSEPTKPYKYGYMLAKFGYNLFYCDSKYSDIIYDKEDGLYYGIGVGIVYNGFVVELFYSINNANGKYKNDNSKIDVDYSKYCISLGYAFDF